MYTTTNNDIHCLKSSGSQVKHTCKEFFVWCHKRRKYLILAVGLSQISGNMACVCCAEFRSSSLFNCTPMQHRHVLYKQMLYLVGGANWFQTNRKCCLSKFNSDHLSSFGNPLVYHGAELAPQLMITLVFMDNNSPLSTGF